MREHKINTLDNFICGWYMDDTSICDKIIEYHTSSNTYAGEMAKGVDETKKKSVECKLKDNELLGLYHKHLQQCVNAYVSKYKFCDYYAAWADTHLPNIQMYEPEGGYYVWHTERCSVFEPYVSRHLVYLTYLNDVTDAGETEFYYQKLKIKPEKGLTLIWGADWTFTHRGIASPSQTKYIATGWYNFINKNADVV